MSTAERKFAARLGSMILSMSLAAAVLAAVRTLLEIAVSQTYSGFGPMRPMVELLHVVVVFSCALLIIEGVATVAGQVGPSLVRLASAGTVCALGASEPLFRRVIHPAFGIQVSELVFIMLAIFSAATIRCWVRGAQQVAQVDSRGVPREKRNFPRGSHLAWRWALRGIA